MPRELGWCAWARDVEQTRLLLASLNPPILCVLPCPDAADHPDCGWQAGGVNVECSGLMLRWRCNQERCNQAAFRTNWIRSFRDSHVS